MCLFSVPLFLLAVAAFGCLNAQIPKSFLTSSYFQHLLHSAVCLSIAFGLGTNTSAHTRQKVCVCVYTSEISPEVLKWWLLCAGRGGAGHSELPENSSPEVHIPRIAAGCGC